MSGTHIKTLRLGFARSLRLRVLVLTLGVFVAISIPAAVAFGWIVNTTIVKLGTLFAQKQILYDRSRGLEALLREVALAETLARSPAILTWAADEASGDKRQRALDELEHYRLAFRDQSYFFVVGASGNYYFNDKANSYGGGLQFRYTLRPENPRDGWYYSTISQQGCQLNVDNDDNLKVTKVWINCVVRDGGRVLGILGTGIDLSTFIRDVVNTDQDGIDSMFVDRTGAIQANRDASAIDFHSLTKDIDAKKTVFQLADGQADRAKLAAMLERVSEDTTGVEARFLRIQGRSMLVGVGYLDRLGWYNVTIMDVDKIIDRDLFLPIGALLVCVMLAAAVLITFLFKRSVLDRLAKAESAVAVVEAGGVPSGRPDRGRDEISRLSAALTRMARSVHENTEKLEETVRERTEQLRRIAYLDPMTGLSNRRGFVEDFAERQTDATVRGVGVGLLLLDIDRFKTINDTRGHSAGDEVIVEVARRLTEVMGQDDSCGRWGGDEFVVLAGDCGHDALPALAARILDVLRSTPIALSNGTKLRITISIGGHMLLPGESLDAAARKADSALYAAKHAGRNRMLIYDAARHGNGVGAPRVA